LVLLPVILYDNHLSNIKKKISCHKRQLMEINQLQKKIGERIRDLRESKGISQQNLAAICNFEKANLSRLEAGRTNPTVSTLNKISQALKISLSEIVDVDTSQQ